MATQDATRRYWRHCNYSYMGNPVNCGIELATHTKANLSETVSWLFKQISLPMEKPLTYEKTSQKLSNLIIDVRSGRDVWLTISAPLRVVS